MTDVATVHVLTVHSCIAVLHVVLSLRWGATEPLPRGSPSPWDWQNANAQYPVFKDYPRVNKNDPEFLKLNTNITVMEGETAFLACRVKNLGEHYMVSWIRRRDVTVLSVGNLAFSSDQRFSVNQVPRTHLFAGDWTLQIVNCSKSDAGLYECQVNSEPKLSQKIRLNVEDRKLTPFQNIANPKAHSSSYQVPKSKLHNNSKVSISEGPRATISGGPVQHVSVGSTVGLECTVSQLSQVPSTLHWTKEGKTLTAKDRSGVSIEAEKLPGVSTTRLFLSRAELSDTGNYSCVADTTTTASVLVIVTKGGDSASALSGHQSSAEATSLTSSALLSLLLYALQT